MRMIGAIIGDIAGSRFEFDNYRKKDFEIFHPDCFFTDDTVMTLAIASAVLQAKGNLPELAEREMKKYGKLYPNRGYGGSFLDWLNGNIKGPYNSWGNGSAMRVSPCGWAAKSVGDALYMARDVTAVTHNHPDGIKGAEAVAVAIYLARKGESKRFIRDYIEHDFYGLDFTIDQIRPNYEFNESCAGTVPQAIVAFLESESFEDAIRTAVSVGGDSDTLAAITGSIAEAYYNVPGQMYKAARKYLDRRLDSVLRAFELAYGSSRMKG